MCVCVCVCVCVCARACEREIEYKQSRSLSRQQHLFYSAFSKETDRNTPTQIRYYFVKRDSSQIPKETCYYCQKRHITSVWSGRANARSKRTWFCQEILITNVQRDLLLLPKETYH